MPSACVAPSRRDTIIYNMGGTEEDNGNTPESRAAAMAHAAKKVAEAVGVTDLGKKIRVKKERLRHQEGESKKNKVKPEELDLNKLRKKREEIQKGLESRNATGKHPDIQVLSLVDEVMVDSDLNATQTDLIKSKLWNLEKILNISDAVQKSAEIKSFFSQADNWTKEAAPYMFEAQRIVYRTFPVEIHGTPPTPEAAGGGGRDGSPTEPPKPPGPPEEPPIEPPQSPDDYNPFSEFSRLKGRDVPEAMKQFVADWEERIRLIQESPEHEVEFWDVFGEERVKKDIGLLESLVREGKAKNTDVAPWQRAINKYLRYLREARNIERYDDLTIRPNEVSDSKFLQSHPNVEPYQLDRYFKPWEKELLSQPDGERLWLKKYMLDKLATPRSDPQPTFVEGIKLESFEHFVEWKYGEVRGREIKHDYRRIRSELEHVHVLNKMLTTEGLSAEKLFEVFMQITPNDLDFLHEFQFVRNALPIYENVVLRLLSKRRARYDELKFGKVDQLHPENNVLSEQQRNSRIKELEHAIQAGRGTPEDRAIEHLELAKLKDERDEAHYGVGLWDDDWNYNATEFSKLSNRSILLDRQTAINQTLEKYSNIESLSPKQLARAGELTSQLNEELKNIEEELRRYPENVSSEQERVLQYEGLSPIERQVADELKLQRKLYWKKNGYSSENAAKKAEEEFQYDGKLAVLMARYHLVYTRHVVAIEANYRVVGEGTKAIMRAPVLEDVERVYAWQVFFRRFGMGDKAGAAALDMFNLETQFRETGKQTKLQETGVWDRLIQAAKSNDEQAMELDAIKVWENESGISFAQVLNNEVFKTGGVYDGSVWRAEIGVTDETRRFMQDLVAEMRAKASPGVETAELDNLGLAFQFGAEDPRSASGIQKRHYLMEKQRRRDPLLFMEYMPVETAKILNDPGFANVDYDKLSRALTLAQNDINTINEYKISSDLNLGGKRDFDAIVAPYLHEMGVTDEAALIRYRRFIEQVQSVAFEKAKVWVRTDFPLTLRMGDLDWEKGTSFQKAGILSMPRRGRDNVGMYKATGIIREVLSTPALLFAPEQTKLFEKILEMEKEIVGYAGYDAAEGAAHDLMAVYLRMNESRVERTLAGWAPGTIVEWGLRQLSEVPTETIEKGVNWVPTWMFRLFGVKADKVEDVRKGAAKLLNGRLLSYAVEYGSLHGNAFTAKTKADIIATAQDHGMFLKHKHYAHALMKEFHARLPDRILGAIQRYYWIVLVGLLTAAVVSAARDEGKK